MQISLLAALSVALAAPIAMVPTAPSSTADMVSTSGIECQLEPLIYVGQDGSLWIGGDAKQKLLQTDANSAMIEVARRSVEKHLAKRDGAVDPKINFCLCSGHSRHSHHGCCESDCNNQCNDPCEEPCWEPCVDPCNNPCDDPCCEPSNECCCADGNCCDELRASCYTKWFCPSTYCNCGAGVCPEDDCNPGCHPVVDGLRSCCATKWLCPSTYCPSNWCCGNSGCCCESNDCCENPCEDPCADPCADPCEDLCCASNCGCCLCPSRWCQGGCCCSSSNECCDTPCESPCNDPCVDACC